jgi:hypothetical protein
LEDGLYSAIIFAPRAIFVILDVLNNASLDWVLMDIAQEGGIVTVNGYGLTVKDLRKPDSILATSVN